MSPEAFQAQSGVSRETLEKFRLYAALLEKWSGAINLVSRSTLPSLWKRHFLDSVQLFDLAPAAARNWLDLGSGAGFPGLVIALLATESRPELKVRLVESDQRKCAFLSTVSRETSLNNVEITNARVETITDSADVVSARAFAPLTQLLAHSSRLISDDGVALFPKGEAVAVELTEARRDWHIEAEQRESMTDPAASVVIIRQFRRRPAP